MSQISHVYLVDLAELATVIGSKDEQLLNRILAKGRDHLLATLPSEAKTIAPSGTRKRFERSLQAGLSQRNSAKTALMHFHVAPPVPLGDVDARCQGWCVWKRVFARHTDGESFDGLGQASVSEPELQVAEV